MESFLFSPQDRPYFHQALWTCIYFTHFPHKNIYFQKKLHPQYSNGGPLTYSVYDDDFWCMKLGENLPPGHNALL